MNRLIFVIFLFLFGLNNVFAKQEEKGTDAVSVGALLMNEASIDNMVEICRHYGLAEVSLSESEGTFTAADGSMIHFTMTCPPGYTRKLQHVEVTKIKHRSKELNNQLEMLGYKKAEFDKVLKSAIQTKGQIYEKGSPTTQTRNICIISTSPTTLIFTKIINNK